MSAIRPAAMPRTEHRPEHTQPHRYRVTLRALPDDVQPDVRVRRALKVLLRSFRLRCVSVRVSR